MNCTVVLLKAFFSGTNSGPRKYGFEVKPGVLDQAVTAFFLRLMQKCGHVEKLCCWGLDCCLGARSESTTSDKRQKQSQLYVEGDRAHP